MTHNIPEFELVHHHDIFVDELQKFQQFIAKQCNIADALILKLISSGKKKKKLVLNRTLLQLHVSLSDLFIYLRIFTQDMNISNTFAR